MPGDGVMPAESSTSFMSTGKRCLLVSMGMGERKGGGEWEREGVGERGRKGGRGRNGQEVAGDCRCYEKLLSTQCCLFI